VRRDLPAETTRKEALDVVAELNADPAVDGYLIQLPVPDQLDAAELLMAVDPRKDADGLHPVNLGLLALGQPGPRPCTPLGIVELLVRHDVPIPGAHVVIVGRGTTVGRPLGMLLSLKEPHANATVTQCHTGTKDLAELTRQADILVAATGRVELITADMVKPGAAVLDVGITRTEAGLVGDVAPEVAEVAGWLAPMPGGVGPMTIALLMRNAVEAAERRAAV
jgi:methylenetetrahydrofolate dehydrogenase (NADP+)/methenyltetrahydrofolate cyclohydrolase